MATAPTVDTSRVRPGWSSSGRARQRGWPELVAEPGAAYTVGGPLAGMAGGSLETDAGADSDPVRAPGGLERLVEQLGEVLGDRARLDGLEAQEVRAQVALLRRLEGMTAAALAASVAALDRVGGVDEDGASSTAAWLAAHTGRSVRDANRMARLADGLAEMPRTADALARGTIVPEAADAVVRAGRDGTLGAPSEVDRALAPQAQGRSPEQLRGEIRRRQQQARGDALLRDERAQHARRDTSLTRHEDGMWFLGSWLTGEMAERAATLLDVFNTPDPEDTPPEMRRSPGQRLTDALDAAITAALDHADLPEVGGVSRPHVSVVVDLETLDVDLADPDAAAAGRDRPVGPCDERWAELPPARTAWGQVLSPQAARRLCCDAAVSRVVTGGPSQVLDVGRETRIWSAPQRRAIAVRDRGCRGPWCNRPFAWTQIHHLQWWRQGGQTDLGNGLALCHACHRRVHDLGWHVDLDPDTAAATWTSPHGKVVVTHPRQPG